jgi:hypothetical protein
MIQFRQAQWERRQSKWQSRSLVSVASVVSQIKRVSANEEISAESQDLKGNERI